MGPAAQGEQSCFSKCPLLIFNFSIQDHFYFFFSFLNKEQHQRAAHEKQFSMLFLAASMAVVTLDDILQKNILLHSYVVAGKECVTWK